MIDGLAKQRAKALKDIEDGKQKERDTLEEAYLTEEQQLLKAQERKRQSILDSEALTAEMKAALLLKHETKSKQQLAELQAQTTETVLKSSSDLFGSLSDVAKTYGGEQSEIYRAMFATSKAFAVAQAGVSIATGIAKTMELPWPASLAAGIQVAAQGAALLSQITSSNYSGAYDKGGMIPAGQIGLVGERGPEFVRGPATVTSRKDTAALREGSQRQSQAPIIRIVNAYEPSVINGHLKKGSGEQSILNVVKNNRTTIRQLAMESRGY
jgi:hypothetical protein